jgi:N-acetylmuramoyl-L-alanine amidase
MHSSFRNPRYFIAAAGILLVATVCGDPPAWWSEGDPPVIDPTVEPNNHGPANIGQAKWMAKSAIDALRPINSDLASAIEQALVGEDKIILTLAPPADEADREKNHAPLLIGQLKAIATPFYDALHAADPVWLEDQLTENQTKDLNDPTNYYPWTQTPNDDRNQAIATIGQLKAVFSLRFQTLMTTLDPNGDADSDGLTNAEELAGGTSATNPDSDSDGIPDGWESKWNFNPIDPSDANADPDGDLVTNLREFEIGTIPTGVYRVEILPLYTNRFFHSASDDDSVIMQSTLVWDPTSGLQKITAPDASGNRSVVSEAINTWNPPSLILNDLINVGILSNTNTLQATDLLSNAGTLRIYVTDNRKLILSFPGEFVSTLSRGESWQFVNNAGQAAALAIRDVPASGAAPAHQAAEIQISQNSSITVIPMPEEWFPAPELPRIQALSDDGKILIQRPVGQSDGTITYEHYLFDTSTGTFSRIHQPGEPNESFVALSNRNARLLGNGMKPFQITPDGTCIYLENLYIQNAYGPVPTKFGTLYPTILNPHHISSSGTITLSCANDQGQQQFLQISPHNDVNEDGILDDFLADLGNRLQLENPSSNSVINAAGATARDLYLALTSRTDTTAQSATSLSGLLDWYYTLLTMQNPNWPFEDDDRDSLSNGKERQLGTNPELPDTDSDERRDAEDADPLDPAVDWQRTSEPGWILKELPVPAQGYGNMNYASAWVSDVSLNGAVLFKTIDLVGRVGEEILVDRNGVVHQTPATAQSTEIEQGHGTRLIGDGILVKSKIPIQNSDGFGVWDPASNRLDPVDLRCYPDDILDAPMGFEVRRNMASIPYNESESMRLWWTGGGKSGRLDDSASVWNDVRIESSGNVHAGSRYWKWNSQTQLYEPCISIPIHNQLGKEHSSSTLVQSSQFGSTSTRNIIPCDESVWANATIPGVFPSTLRLTAIKPKTSAHFVAATTDGWLVEGGPSGRAWANGKWQSARYLVAGPRPELLNIVKMRDTGVGVAVVKYPNQTEKFMLMVPAAATALAPLLPMDDVAATPVANPVSALPNHLRHDEAGNNIENLDTTNPMVERDPLHQITDASTRRIAWREIKVKVGKMLAGKTVTWSMTPLFTPRIEMGSATNIGEMIAVPVGEPCFRGDKAHAARVQDRHPFGPSEHFGSIYNFEVTNRDKTTIDAQGYTAIRVNLPPIGFNKARVSIEISGVPGKLDLIDLEVPAVIVIDPGHGIGPAGGSNQYGGTAISTKVVEHQFSLDIGFSMKNHLIMRQNTDQLCMKVFMTRSNSKNRTFQERTAVARMNGCDVYASIHFNGNNKVPNRRHPFGMWDIHNNQNLEEDKALAVRLRHAIQVAIANTEPEDSRNLPTDGETSESQERNVQKRIDTCSDSQNGSTSTPNYNGNIDGHTPCRSALIEIESMSNVQADLLFNNGYPNLLETPKAMRGAASIGLANAAILDLFVQPTR